MADRSRGVYLIGLVIMLAGCAAVSQRAEHAEEVTVPVNPDAAHAPIIEVSGTTDGLCGGEGGCIYAATLSGPHAEGFGYQVGWEFERNPDGTLTVPDDVEMPRAVPGTHVIQLYAQHVSDVRVNDERQLEAVVARCNARFDVDEDEREVVIEVAFTFEDPDEGLCSLARLGAPMEPALTFAPTPSR